MDAFFQGLGDSLVGTGVRVMIVRPGFVHTKMTDGMDAAPLSTTPEAVADAIVHGLARDRETVWVPAHAALRDVGAAPRAPPGLPQAPHLTPALIAGSVRSSRPLFRPHTEKSVEHGQV